MRTAERSARDEENTAGFVLVPVVMDDEGYWITRTRRPPHGYHHLLRLYKDDSWWLEATFNGETSTLALQAAILALTEGHPVIWSESFYEDRAKHGG